jgi:hypothetical protein
MRLPAIAQSGHGELECPMSDAVPGFAEGAVTVRAMGRNKLLYVLVPLYLMLVGALVVKQLWLREEEKPVATKDNPPLAREDKAPVVGKTDDAGPQAGESSDKRGLTPNCEKELRRTADLIRFFANRIQAGEEIQSVVADMRQQEKRISAVCPD